MATRPDGGGLAYRSGRGAARASQLRKTEKERASAIAPPIPRTRPHFDSALPDRPAIVATPMGPRTSRPPEDDAAMDTIAAAAISHEQRDKLGALALDVLSRQAEARVLFAGREFVDKRASEHDVTRETAATAAGNLRTILERGPETAHERGLVAAFAVAGADARFEKADAEERIAAAIALSHAEPEVRGRVRIALDACADEPARVAIEKALDGEIEAAEIEATLAERKAQEAR